MRGLSLSLRNGLSVAGGPLFGPELVTNGTFDTDVSGWGSEVNATAAFDTGRMKLTNTAGGANEILQTVTGLLVGERYRVQGTIELGNTANMGRFNIGGATSILHTIADNGTTLDQTFTATTTSLAIYLQIATGGAWGAAGDYAFFDNISLKRLA